VNIGGTKSPLVGFGAGERVCLATTIEGTTKKSTLVPAEPPRYTRRLPAKHVRCDWSCAIC